NGVASLFQGDEMDPGARAGAVQVDHHVAQGTDQDGVSRLQDAVYRFSPLRHGDDEGALSFPPKVARVFGIHKVESQSQIGLLLRTVCVSVSDHFVSQAFGQPFQRRTLPPISHHGKRGHSTSPSINSSLTIFSK